MTPELRPGEAAITAGPRIAVLDGDDRQVSGLQRLLAPLGRVECGHALAELHAPESCDLVVAGYDRLPPAEREALLSRFAGAQRARLLLCSEGKARDDYASLFGSRSMTNLLARKGELDAADLLVTVEKLLRRDIFGIEKYFPAAEPVRFRVTSSSQKEGLIAEAEKLATGAGVHARLVGLYCTVADELLTNAVYNAPVDGEGRRRFAHLSRTERVDLSSSEEVELKLCCDGRRLGISVSDPFGSLTADKVLGYLAKAFRKGQDQIDDKAGGAGLGLYYIFESLTHFVINLNPGRRTEMIGILEVAGSYRDFASTCKSFNVFVGQ